MKRPGFGAARNGCGQHRHHCCFETSRQDNPTDPDFVIPAQPDVVTSSFTAGRGHLATGGSQLATSSFRSCRKFIIRHSGAVSGFIGNGTRNPAFARHQHILEAGFRVLPLWSRGSPGMTNYFYAIRVGGQFPCLHSGGRSASWRGNPESRLLLRWTGKLDRLAASMRRSRWLFPDQVLDTAPPTQQGSARKQQGRPGATNIVSSMLSSEFATKCRGETVRKLQTWFTK